MKGRCVVRPASVVTLMNDNNLTLEDYNSV